MYAILQHGGHQYRVASGDRILVDRIPVEVGSTVTLESVLLLGDGAEADVAKGSPVEASVTATVIAHRKGRKIRVFTYKPKKRHRRTLGYRSQLTELRIDDVSRGKADTKPKAAAAKPKPAEAAAKTADDTASKKPAAKRAAAAPQTDAVADDAIAEEAAAIVAEADAVGAEADAAVAQVASAEHEVEAAAAADDEPKAAKPAPKRKAAPKPKKDPDDGA
jgi:large subunit ribosomal protein L21